MIANTITTKESSQIMSQEIESEFNRKFRNPPSLPPDRKAITGTVQAFFKRHSPLLINSQGRTFFHLTLMIIGKEQQSIVYELLSYLFNNARDLLDYPDHSGMTPLHYAIHYSSKNSKGYEVKTSMRVNLIDLLLRHGAEPNYSSKACFSYVVYAMDFEILEERLIEILTSYGLNIHALDDNGDSVLHFVVKKMKDKDTKKLKEIITHLCKNKQLHLEQANKEGKRPIHYALDCVEMVKTLVICGAKITCEDPEEPNILFSIFNENYPVLNKGLVKLLPVQELNQKDNNGNTILHLALKNLEKMNVSEVIWLINYMNKNNIALMDPDSSGMTPLYILIDKASKQDSKEDNPRYFNVKLFELLLPDKLKLLEYKSPEGRNVFHEVILHWAETGIIKFFDTSNNKQKEILVHEMLIAMESALLNSKTEDGLSAYHICLAKPNEAEVFKWLKEKGCSFDCPTSDYPNLLFYYISQAESHPLNTEILVDLSQAKDDVLFAEKDNRKNSILHLICENLTPEIYNTIFTTSLECGNETNDLNYTPLALLLESFTKRKDQQSLIRNGINRMLDKNFELTPTPTIYPSYLHLALASRYYDNRFIDYCIERESSFLTEAVKDTGDTLLHLFLRGLDDVVLGNWNSSDVPQMLEKLLMNAQETLNVSNNSGQFPLGAYLSSPGFCTGILRHKILFHLEKYGANLMVSSKSYENSLIHALQNEAIDEDSIKLLLPKTRGKTVVFKIYELLFEKCKTGDLMPILKILIQNGLIFDMIDERYSAILQTRLTKYPVKGDYDIESLALNFILSFHESENRLIPHGHLFELIKIGAFTTHLYSYYVRNGGRINMKDENSNNLLHIMFQSAASATNLKSHIIAVNTLINKHSILLSDGLCQQVNSNQETPLEVLAMSILSNPKAGNHYRCPGRIPSEIFRTLIKHGAVLSSRMLLMLFDLGIYEIDFIHSCSGLKESLFQNYPEGKLFGTILKMIKNGDFNESDSDKIIRDVIAPKLFENAGEDFSKIDLIVILKEYGYPKVLKPIVKAMTEALRQNPNLILKDKIGNNLIHCFSSEAVHQSRYSGYPSDFFQSKGFFSKLPETSLAIMINQTNISQRTPLHEGLIFLRGSNSKNSLASFVDFLRLCTPHYAVYSISQVEEYENMFSEIIEQTPRLRLDLKAKIHRIFLDEMKILKVRIFSIVESRKGMFRKLSCFHFYEIRRYLIANV